MISQINIPRNTSDFAIINATNQQCIKSNTHKTKDTVKQQDNKYLKPLKTVVII